MPVIAPMPVRPSGSPVAHFATTGWSRVLRAGADDAAARPALADLCGHYWYPLYAYLRRRGHTAPDAEDAVQGFFTWLIEANTLRYADPSRGRFRGFLVAAMNQYLAGRHRFDSAGKRKPDQPFVRIDAIAAEERLRWEPSDGLTPERILDYSWAIAVVGQAMERLKAEQQAAGRANLFDAVQGLLSGQRGETTSAAKALGLSDGAVRVAVHRLRRRYAELLQAIVRETLGEDEDAEAELRHLLNALSAGRPR
jgi:DNA-directed RNA polymerase specialized sigma24 family protein